MKKFIAIVVIMLLLATVMVGCTTKEETTDAPKATAKKVEEKTEEKKEEAPKEEEVEVVEITILSNPTTPEQQVHEDELTAAFEAANPGIKVKRIPSNDSNTLLQQLAAGVGPDMITHVDKSKIAEYVEAGYLLNLDKYVDEYGWNERFSEASLKSYQHDGTQYLTPGKSIMMTVYYNKDMFAENGWAVPTTYQELVTICDALVEQDIAPFTFGVADFKQAYDRWITMIFNGYLGNDGMKKVITGEYRMDGPEVRATFEFLVDFYQKYVYENAPSITEDDANTLFYQNKAAMFATGQWQLNRFVNGDVPFEWGQFCLPGLQDGQEGIIAGGYGAGDGINSTTEHPDEAAKYLDFMNADEQAEWLLINEGLIFPRTNGYSDEAMAKVNDNFKEEIELYNLALNEDRIGYATWAYFSSSTQNYAWGNLEALILDQITMDDYIEGLQAAYDDDVANGRIYAFQEIGRASCRERV